MAMISVIQFNLLAKDGAGGRGGGTGVICKSENIEHIYLLEEYLMLKEGQQINFPPSRNQTLRFMEIRLQNHPDFFQKWKVIWEAIGSYESWGEYSLAIDPDFTNTMNYPKEAREHYKNTFIMAYDYRYLDFVSQGMLNEKDDLAVVDDHCQKVSLSVIIDDLIFKYHQRLRLSEKTKRMLEIHESLFFLGIHEYSHIFASNTQKLIKNINSGRNIQSSLREFEQGAHYNYFKHVNGLYINTENNQCPKSLSYLFETKNRYIAHNPLKTLALNKYDNQKYYYQKDLPLPIGKIEIQSDEGFYSLEINHNEYTHRFDGDFYTVLKGGKPICKYEQKISGEKIRTLKFLNRISNYKYFRP